MEKCEHLQKTPTHLVVTVSEILKIIFYHQNVGQGQRIQFSQRHRSMAIVKIYKRLAYIFAQALTVSQIITLKIVDLESQVNGVQF